MDKTMYNNENNLVVLYMSNNMYQHFLTNTSDELYYRYYLQKFEES